MIAKLCLVALLAAVAVAKPMDCNTRPVCAQKCTQNVVVASPCKTVSCSGSGSSGSTGSSGSGSVLTRNVVVKGKFPVALSNCGPTPDKQIPLTTSHVRAPVQVKPTVRLPCNVPPPKVVSHTCTCYKTVVRPRVHDQILTVPTVQRYIETTHKPVVENIHYEACPTNCDNSNSGPYVFARQDSQSSQCGQQTVSSPCTQTVQVAQTVSSPCTQTVSSPCTQTVQVAQPVQVAQTVSSPCSQTVQVAQPVQVSCAQPVQVSCPQQVEMPCSQPVQVEPVQVSCAQPVQVSCPQQVEVPCTQTVQVPQVQVQRVEVPTVQVPQVSFEQVQVPTCQSCQ